MKHTATVKNILSMKFRGVSMLQLRKEKSVLSYDEYRVKMTGKISHFEKANALMRVSKLLFWFHPSTEVGIYHAFLR